MKNKDQRSIDAPNSIGPKPTDDDGQDVEAILSMRCEQVAAEQVVDQLKKLSRYFKRK